MSEAERVNSSFLFTRSVTHIQTEVQTLISFLIISQINFLKVIPLDEHLTVDYMPASRRAGTEISQQKTTDESRLLSGLSKHQWVL